MEEHEFRYWLDDDVKHLASLFEKTQAGWIDTNIGEELAKTNTSQMELYWFTITLTQVNKNDPFIQNHKKKHIDCLKNINNTIRVLGKGKILYYDLNSTRIQGLIKVESEIKKNKEYIADLLQRCIDGLAQKYADYLVYPPEYKWKVSLRDVKDLDDINSVIRVTIEDLKFGNKHGVRATKI